MIFRCVQHSIWSKARTEKSARAFYPRNASHFNVSLKTFASQMFCDVLLQQSTSPTWHCSWVSVQWKISACIMIACAIGWISNFGIQLFFGWGWVFPSQNNGFWKQQNLAVQIFLGEDGFSPIEIMCFERNKILLSFTTELCNFVRTVRPPWSKLFWTWKWAGVKTMPLTSPMMDSRKDIIFEISSLRVWSDSLIFIYLFIFINFDF